MRRYRPATGTARLKLPWSSLRVAATTVNSAVVSATSARATATPELSRTLPSMVSAPASGAKPHRTPRNTESRNLAGLIAGM